MRKTLVLLAVAALLALSAAVFGSPPTTEKTFKKIQIVKTDSIATADTSAVAPRDTEARTCETFDAQTLNDYTKTTPVKTDYAATVNRQGYSPPERLPSGNAESRATNGKTMYERAEAGPPLGYVMRR